MKRRRYPPVFTEGGIKISSRMKALASAERVNLGFERWSLRTHAGPRGSQARAGRHAGRSGSSRNRPPGRSGGLLWYPASRGPEKPGYTLQRTELLLPPDAYARAWLTISTTALAVGAWFLAHAGGYLAPTPGGLKHVHVARTIIPNLHILRVRLSAACRPRLSRASLPRKGTAAELALRRRSRPT